MQVRRPPWTREPVVVVATLAALAASVALVVVPLVKLAQTVFEDGGSSISRVLRAPGLGTAALHTVLLASVVPLIAVPLGAAAALFLRRPDVAFRGLLRFAVVLPLIVPQFVLGYSWTRAYGRAGLHRHRLRDLVDPPQRAGRNCGRPGRRLRRRCAIC